MVRRADRSDRDCYPGLKRSVGGMGHSLAALAHVFVLQHGIVGRVPWCKEYTEPLQFVSDVNLW